MHISAQDAYNLHNPLFLDVREPNEWEICHIPGAQLIPLDSLPSQINTLPNDQPIIVYCHHGGRSEFATNLLHANGFQNALNLTGGIDHWAQTIDPSLNRY